MEKKDIGQEIVINDMHRLRLLLLKRLAKAVKFFFHKNVTKQSSFLRARRSTRTFEAVPFKFNDRTLTQMA